METKLIKTELHAELLRINSRVKFLRAANYGTALSRTTIEELNSLQKARDFVLSELKK